jgi:hypothetical protein
MTVTSDLPEVDQSEEHLKDDVPYAARAAICFLAVEDEGNDIALYNKICAALREDSRIESLEAPVQGPNAFDRPTFSIFDYDTSAEYEENDDDDVPDPASHLHGFHFDDPIIFEMSVPKRVQPRFGNLTWIPATRYWAAWDGIALVVLWKLEDFEASGSAPSELSISDVLDSLASSGGLIVQRVLKDAAEKCDYELMSTPCSPNCSYTFAHTGLSVEAVDLDEDLVFEQDDEESFARVRLPVSENSPSEVVSELHSRVAFLIKIFAEMRSEGRTAVAAGSSGRRDLRNLLTLNYERAKIGAEPFWKTFGARWNTRRWRKTSRLLIARMWLTLATLDRAKQNWAKLKSIYDDAASDDNIGVIFSSEYGYEVQGTSGIDVSEVRSALERITNTLDSRVLVLWTGAGAVIGAIIGAVVGHLT